MTQAPGVSPLAELSEREMDVVRALLAGHTTNRAIAAHLVIDHRTAQTHLASIFSKLHISDRVELVLVAIQCGLPVTVTWHEITHR